MNRLTFHLVIAAIGIPLGTGIAMAIDSRVPPYYRTGAAITAAAPEDCGLPASMATSDVMPGHCVYTVYFKHDLRKDCQPVPGGHVTRIIEKNGRTRSLPKLPPAYGPEAGVPFPDDVLIRAWMYPVWGGEWDQDGDAIYNSSACYICGYWPLAENPFNKIVSVCVTEPSIPYRVSAPPK